MGRKIERVTGDAAVASCAVMADTEVEPVVADLLSTEAPLVTLCLVPALAYFLDDALGAVAPGELLTPGEPLTPGAVEGAGTTPS